jgi:hypothetical protein
MAEYDGNRPLDGAYGCEEEADEMEQLLAAQAAYIEEQLADEFPHFTYKAQVLLEPEDLDKWIAILRNNLRLVEREENLRHNAERIATKLGFHRHDLDKAS